jgi:hypothetical protein
LIIDPRTACRAQLAHGFEGRKGVNNEVRIINTILVCLLIAMVGGSCRMIDTLTANSKAGTGRTCRL